MIKTKRLNIVEATEKDITSIMEIEQDKENRDYIWIGTYKQHLDEIKDSTHLLLLFKEKATDETVGFGLINMDFKSNLFEIRRIAIVKKGIGYGKESMKAIIKYAFEETDTNKIWLDVYPHNVKAIKLYEGLGFHKDGVLRQNYKSERGYLDQAVYSILRDEYKGFKD